MSIEAIRGKGLGSGCTTHNGLVGCHLEVCFDRAFQTCNIENSGPRSLLTVTVSALLTSTRLASGLRPLLLFGDDVGKGKGERARRAPARARTQ